jgi:single-strand DNA-binding protein
MLPIISGEFRVATDPQLRFTPSGMAICDIRAVATRRKQNTNTQEWEDANTFWAKVTGFKKQAENMAESFKIGDLVVIHGTVETQEWEQEGNKRIAVNILLGSIGHSTAFDASTTLKQARPQGGGGTQTQPQSQPQSTGPADPDEPPF